jgi:aryl-alcohol dehydrogenase-like predicted oxidoreductase
MRYIPLPNGIPDASVLGLGCAAMMGSASRRDSLAALSAAAAAGINFFDTARSYGYGASEGLLGEYFKCRRDKVVLCTKFGILPAPNNWKQRIKPLARTAIRLFPGLRKTIRKQAGELSTANNFSVEVLRTSLETSLRELHTDYVDILLMHAAPIGVLAQQDLLGELGRFVSEGKVRLAGISAEPDVIAATLTQRPPVLQTAQFACNISNFAFLNQLEEQLASQPKLFLVANHPFGGPTGVAESRRRIGALHNDSKLSAELRAKLDPADPQLLPEVILNAILSGTGIDAIVPAMLQPHHLKSNTRAIEQCRFTDAELIQIREALSL